MQVQNISFGARYVKSATIKKYTPEGLKKHNISLVELNPLEINDIKCISEVNIDWGGSKSLTHCIMQNMLNIFIELPTKCSSYFYALTRQKDNFKDLEPEKILSVAQISDFDEKMISIDLLETSFEESHKSKGAKYKHVGQGMLDNIKFLNFGKDILIETPEENETFYIKNGFEKVYGGINRFIFRSAKY